MSFSTNTFDKNNNENKNDNDFEPDIIMPTQYTTNDTNTETTPIAQSPELQRNLRENEDQKCNETVGIILLAALALTAVAGVGGAVAGVKKDQFGQYIAGCMLLSLLLSTVGRAGYTALRDRDFFSSCNFFKPKNKHTEDYVNTYSATRSAELPDITERRMSLLASSSGYVG